MKTSELCQKCRYNEKCEVPRTGHPFCCYLGQTVKSKRIGRAERGLAPREDAVWGIVGGFVYGVVRVLGVVDTFDVYVAPLPKGRIDVLPSASFRNRVNSTGFRSEAAARNFLRDFLMTEKHVPEEEIGPRLIRTRWQSPQNQCRKRYCMIDREADQRNRSILGEN